MDLIAFRDQLDAIRRDVGLFSGSAFLEGSVDQLEQLAADNRIVIDVYISNACKALAPQDVIQSSSELDIRYLYDDAHLRCIPGLRRAGIGVFICLSEEMAEALSMQRAWRFFLNHANQYFVRQLVVIGVANQESIDLTSIGVSKRDALELLTAQSVNELSPLIAGLGDRCDHRQLSELKQRAVAPVFDRLKGVISAEMSTLNLRRQIIASEQERGRRQEQGASNDAQSAIRGAIQKNFQDTDRLFRQKYEELCRPNVGEFSKLIGSIADSLTDAHILKIDKAADFEKFETQIDQQFLNAKVELIKQSFNKEVAKDVKYVTQMAGEAEGSVNEILRRQTGMDGGANALVRPELDMAKLDKSNFQLNKTFKGELTKPGVMEYFGALRDYTGLIMVIVGILAPLTMLATAPDADPGSFLGAINKVSGELKEIRAYIQFATVVLIFAMLVYGAFDLRKRIPNKRRQEIERETLEAREFISEQLGRLMNDAHRDWVAMLGQYVKDYSQALQTEADAILRRYSAAQKEIATDRKNAAQLEQASVEHKLKNLSLAERASENLVRKFQDSVERTATAAAIRQSRVT